MDCGSFYFLMQISKISGRLLYSPHFPITCARLSAKNLSLEAMAGGKRKTGSARIDCPNGIVCGNETGKRGGAGKRKFSNFSVGLESPGCKLTDSKIIYRKRKYNNCMMLMQQL